MIPFHLLGVMLDTVFRAAVREGDSPVCGRYYSQYSKQQLAESLRTRVGFAISANYNVAPATFQPVVQLDSKGVREAVVMRWGLVPYWSKDAKSAYSMINTKAETVLPQHAMRIPLETWYRFRLAAEQARTALILLPGNPSNTMSFWIQQRQPIAWASAKISSIAIMVTFRLRDESEGGCSFPAWESKSTFGSKHVLTAIQRRSIFNQSELPITG